MCSMWTYTKNRFSVARFFSLMLDGLVNDFQASLYKNINNMMKHGWSYTELINLSPLDLNVFKMLIQEHQKK